ncbi:helix-turn-helix domain-containing protein [Microbacteriaceae bacterium VKM Ac-2854]|nr:helix-turn-helix domain-containing protein [Microbacteriaceae bacterium VKM Ac-2854]
MADFSVERQLALQNEEAVSWLEHRGFQVHSYTRPFHVFTDEIRQDDFVLRRVWFTAAHASRAADTGPERRFEASLVIEGDGTVDIDRAGAIGLGAGQLLLRTRAVPLEVRTTQPAAVIQVESKWDRLTHLGSAPTEPFEANEEYASVFATLATAILNSTIGPTDGGFTALRRAVEAALSAIVADPLTGIRQRMASAAQWTLYQRAVTLIAARADDAALDVSVLASELAVSKQYLQRAFRAAGTSPMRYLRLVRATNARALLDANPAAGRDDLEAIAHQTGFNTVETMNDVITRELRPS